MYAGLFTFTALMVYGLSGLMDSTLPAWSERQSPPTTEQFIRFKAPSNLGDKEVADLVYAYLDMPLTGPAADYSSGRDKDQNLTVRFYTVNGVRTVTVLEEAGQLKIVRAQGGMVSFVTGMHGSRMMYASPRFLAVAWTVISSLELPLAVWIRTLANPSQRSTYITSEVNVLDSGVGEVDLLTMENPPAH